MKLPLHWARGTASETDGDGKDITFSCWRWSDVSQEDAQQSAFAAARHVLQKFRDRGPVPRYSYGDRPLREEVMQKLLGDRGELIGAVTQNAYGSLVLNSARVMFIDIDFPMTTLSDRIGYFFARLFNKAAQPPDARREQEVRLKLQQFGQAETQWSARLYRTFAGMRVLATNSLYDPTAQSTLALFESLGTDPLYVRLCKVQECFRARLTPKPWRCGHTQNRIPWPRDVVQEAPFRQWLAAYGEACSRFATCRFLGTLGGDLVHPEAVTLIELHDKATRCHEGLPLA